MKDWLRWSVDSGVVHVGSMDIAWAFRSWVINVGLCLVAGQGVRGGLGSIAG